MTQSTRSRSKTVRTLSVVTTLARAGLALSRNRPKRALLLAGAALLSLRSTALGTAAQILIELLERRQ
jgi:hypothetical protein